MWPKYFQIKTEGKANEDVVVKGENYRFSVLTPRLIRMEYSKDGAFDDRATQRVVSRNFPLCKFDYYIENDVLNLKTEFLSLSYKLSGEFSKENLSVTMSDGKVWCFGDETNDLLGTTRTLDGVDGAVPLEHGICSRDGFTVLDDSRSMRLDDEGWIAIPNSYNTDIYFFGYGHDYKDCISDFYRLTGAPPLLPAYALGNWWSRYHKYTQDEYINLMQRFENEDIPFSVAVIDMDWHPTHFPDEPRGYGWTGYSWNKELFPDHVEFLNWLHKHNYRTSLNLHPADGVRWQEDMYKEMAEKMGIDPETKTPIHFDITDKKFLLNYFDVLHHPHEKDGIDFWWIDWQQGNKTKVDGLDPLWMLNHYHTLDIARDGKRPMIFSRYSGPGSQRYPVGFSGDSVVSWESLDFQPYFTANASNIGYGWWSHDIGGHFKGYRDDELNVRWVQLGVFSPINRLHSCNAPLCGKEPWNFSPWACESIKKALRLRHELFPYLYTMNYRNSFGLLPIVEPMYYEYPENAEAYEVPDQFFFGTEMFVRPITQKADDVSCLGMAKIWFPEGKWFDMFRGDVYSGNKMTEVCRPLDEIPAFCKSGAIVPLQQHKSHDNKIGLSSDMKVLVFPGANNSFTLYEDEGENNNYKDGVYSKTEFNLEWKNNPTFTINAAWGVTDFLPQKRNWSVDFRGVKTNISVSVYVDGKSAEFTVSRDVNSNTVSVSLCNVDIKSEVKIQINDSIENIIYDNSNYVGRCYDILMHAQMDYDVKNDIYVRMCANKDMPYDERKRLLLRRPHLESINFAILEQLQLYFDKY